MDSQDQFDAQPPAENEDIPLVTQEPFIERPLNSADTEATDPAPQTPPWLQRVNSTLQSDASTATPTEAAQPDPATEDPAWLQRLHQKDAATVATPNWQDQLAVPTAAGHSTKTALELPPVVGIGILLWLASIVGDVYFGYIINVLLSSTLLEYGLLTLLIPMVCVTYLMQGKNWARFIFALVVIWSRQADGGAFLLLFEQQQLSSSEIWRIARLGLGLVSAFLFLLPSVGQWIKQPTAPEIEIE